MTFKHIVDNKAGIFPNETSVLEIFRERINRAINEQKEISFRIAVGFFFFEGFQRIYPELKKLYEKKLLREFKVVMGPETRKTTKEILEALKNDATALDDESFSFLKRLYNEGKFDFRIFLERNFHIKLYLFELGNEIEIWAGSANFTEAGLEENIELIVPTAALTFDEKDLYRKFFNEIWKRSTDKVENLKVIDVIGEASLSKIVFLHPRDFIINLIKILGKEYLLKNISADLSYLGEFQNISYYHCIRKMLNYGGCVLANSFGLGKTDVGCMVARYYKELGKKVLIVYPPILKQHWETTLKKIGLNPNEVMWLSRGVLQARDFDYEKYKGIDLIIVDEAHHFRISKPKSNRRENLENIIKINPSSHILLITATPINLSFLDFTALLRLFIKGSYKEKLESEGLLSKIREIEHDVKKRNITRDTINKLNKLIELFSIRIEWPDLPIHFKEDLKKIANVEKIEPPDVFPVTYNYDEEIAEKIFDNVVPFLSKLNFEYTKLWEKEYKEDKNLIWWYKWRLYKRLESSIIAFQISLENILKKNKFLIQLLQDFSKFRKKTYLFSKERLDNIQRTFLSLSDAKKKKVIERIKQDITLIEEMLKNIREIKDFETRDKKVKKLFEILEKEQKPTIVFSESRDTVIYIGKKLKQYGKFKFNLAYGGEVQIDEEDEQKRFGKVDKETIEKDFNEGQFDILVTTDILSEGVNLPRADVVINFDLPYNPVRLIQRDGRAIRITNPKKIVIYNFEPDERIDKELELCERLAQRVENIISTIGLDFLIWAIERGKLKRVSERNRKRTIKLIRAYRHDLASKHPEELGKKMPLTLSKEDIALREFIKYWGISDETLRNFVKTYKKPIFTALAKKTSSPYFVVFKYKNALYTLGDLYFSDKKIETNLTIEELEKIKNLIAEKCLEMDREFLKTERERDNLTIQIEKLLEKNREERLKNLFKTIDVSILPRNEKRRILDLLKEMKKLPPWKKEDKISGLIAELNNILKNYQFKNTLQEPQVIAVIKYV